MKQSGLLRSYLKYVSLNALGMLGISFYILADTFFVARGMGAAGLTALNLAIPVFSLTNGAGLMLGMGSAIRYTVLRSQGRQKDADRSIVAALWLAAAISALYVTLGLLADRPLAVLLGADADSMERTRIYLRVLLLFSPAFLLNNIVLCLVRNDGAPQLSMAAMVIGSLGNVVLDYVFIFPLGMDIFGAVLATGLAPIISLTLLSIHFLRKKNQMHPVFGLPRPRDMGATLRLGLPSLINEFSSGLVILVFNSIFLRLGGNLAVAAYGVVVNLFLVAQALHTGVAQGTQPLFSHAHGAGDPVGIRKNLRYAIVTIAVISAAIYGLLALLDGPVVAAFNSEGDALLQRIAQEGLLLYFLALPFAGWNILLSMFFAATERALPAQVLSLLRGLVVIIPMAFLMAALWGMTGAWLAFPATEVLVCAVGLGMWLAGRRRA